MVLLISYRTHNKLHICNIQNLFSSKKNNIGGTFRGTLKKAAYLNSDKHITVSLKMNPLFVADPSNSRTVGTSQPKPQDSR